MPLQNFGLAADAAARGYRSADEYIQALNAGMVNPRLLAQGPAQPAAPVTPMTPQLPGMSAARSEPAPVPAMLPPIDFVGKASVKPSHSGLPGMTEEDMRIAYDQFVGDRNKLAEERAQEYEEGPWKVGYPNPVDPARQFLVDAPQQGIAQGNLDADAAIAARRADPQGHLGGGYTSWRDSKIGQTGIVPGSGVNARRIPRTLEEKALDPDWVLGGPENRLDPQRVATLKAKHGIRSSAEGRPEVPVSGSMFGGEAAQALDELARSDQPTATMGPRHLAGSGDNLTETARSDFGDVVVRTPSPRSTMELASAAIKREDDRLLATSDLRRRAGLSPEARAYEDYTGQQHSPAELRQFTRLRPDLQQYVMEQQAGRPGTRDPEELRRQADVALRYGDERKAASLIAEANHLQERSDVERKFGAQERGDALTAFNIRFQQASDHNREFNSRVSEVLNNDTTLTRPQAEAIVSQRWAPRMPLPQAPDSVSGYFPSPQTPDYGGNDFASLPERQQQKILDMKGLDANQTSDYLVENAEDLPPEQVGTELRRKMTDDEIREMYDDVREMAVLQNDPKKLAAANLLAQILGIEPLTQEQLEAERKENFTKWGVPIGTGPSLAF